MRTLATAHIDAKLAAHRLEPALQCRDDAGRHAGGMSVHAHDCPEGLKPKGVREPAQQFVAPIFTNDRWTMTRPTAAIRVASHGGTRPPCRGKSALPLRRCICAKKGTAQETDFLAR